MWCGATPTCGFVRTMYGLLPKFYPNFWCSSFLQKNENGIFCVRCVPAHTSHHIPLCNILFGLNTSERTSPNLNIYEREKEREISGIPSVWNTFEEFSSTNQTPSVNQNRSGQFDFFGQESNDNQSTYKMASIHEKFCLGFSVIPRRLVNH